MRSRLRRSHLFIERSVNELITAQALNEGFSYEDTEKAIKNYNKAVGKGILKVMNKVGISTLNSYRGSQIFECIGLNSVVVRKYFPITPTRIEGIGLMEIIR